MQNNIEIRPFVPKPETPGALYRREVKSQLMKVVLVVVAYLFIQLIITGVIEAVIMFSSGAMNNMVQGAMGAASGGQIDMGNLVESSTASALEVISKYTGLISIISAVASLPIFLILRGRRMFTTDIAESHAPLSGLSFVKLWVIAMGAQLVFDVCAQLLNSLLGSSGRSATELLDQSMQILQTPTGLLYICIVGPIVEELIFRGAVMRSLERFGLNFSIFISSLIFGLFHIFTVQAVFAFFMGLILGYIASRYSIKWSILAHILINSAATGMSVLGSLGGEGGFAVYAAYLIQLAFFVCGVILLIVERWRFAEQRKVGAPLRIPGSPENTGAALWRAAFTSVPLLIFIVVTFGAGIGMIAAPTFSIPGFS
ncbi:MAG: CPBP family intramembrane metalloprotease [Clostridiales Family XIII bacterium]|jgi:membrane protease YdiL (CAAX protease family)|nr:CPBP family intramembrane metalloprotease [Clostridiales Family XIII bacterium]